MLVESFTNTNILFVKDKINFQTCLDKQIRIL